MVGLRGRAAELVEARIKRFIRAYNEEPQFLTASVVGTMLADLADANRFLRKSWEFVHKQLDKGVDPTELISISEELRRWAKLTQETALRVAEISRRGREGTPDDYLRGRYGARAEIDDKGEETVEGVPTVPVTVVSGGEPAGRPGACGTPFDTEAPEPEPRPAVEPEGEPAEPAGGEPDGEEAE